MITEKHKIVYTPAEETRTFTARDSALITLGVAARFIVCLAAIAAGLYIAVRGDSHGMAVLAACGCGAVIYALLSPKKED